MITVYKVFVFESVGACPVKFLLKILRLFLSPLEVKGRVLDPQIRAILFIANRKKRLEAFEPIKARQQALKSQRLMPRRVVAVDLVEDFNVDGIAMRRYRPFNKEASRGLLYFHGGGFVIGGLDSHDHVCRALAVEGDCEVISVDYRLAPEHPFPAATDDAMNAWNWFKTQAYDEFLVGGDSAGGTLAIVISQQSDSRPDGQLLIYPSTNRHDKKDPNGPFADGFLYTVSMSNYFTKHYLPKGTDTTDHRVSPAFRANLSDQPPAHLVVAGYDILYDEGIDYAKRLAEAGVPVTIQDEQSLVHGFIALAGASERAWRAVKDAGTALKTLSGRKNSSE